MNNTEGQNIPETAEQVESGFLKSFAKQLLDAAVHFLRSYILLIVFSCLFALGFFIILFSGSWNLGAYEAMQIAGGVLCLFSGTGVLCELYVRKRPPSS